MFRTLLCFAVAVLVCLAEQCSSDGQEPFSHRVGLSRIDVTPTEPVRMAGYGSRNRPSDGVATPLYVRCMAIQGTVQEPPALLISIETIGLPGSMTREMANQIEEQYHVKREKIVFCSTHTHAAPDLVSELSNIFATPLSEDEIAAGQRYKKQLRQGIIESVKMAIDSLAPAKLSYAEGAATFAANRRVLENGRWKTFGVQLDGLVDHSVPVLRVTDDKGEIRGIVFNYACHCTTLTGKHYQINGDWAGYASSHLESKFTGAVALCTIGCGADANPEPRGTVDAAKLHGRTLADEVLRAVTSKMHAIEQPATHRFDYAALTFDLPTREEIEARLEIGDAQTKRHAEQLMATQKKDGRLPATYPVPIQSWRFGDDLTMVFLGGEVVVEYALRLKKELDDPNLWVTAYANDVLGYIASEKMRREGGYEYDRSGVYYGLPGPWAGGTEDLLISRVKEMLKSKGRSRPLNPDNAMRSIKVSEGYSLQLVACEPLVQDPINVAFDSKGQLWVVEMSDYPHGETEHRASVRGRTKTTGGSIKTLRDTNNDGVFDTASIFLSALPYPTGVHPWRDGVLISCAPDILFARDSNGDGKADEVQKLFTGFRLANPQHRVNGFTYGLDHSLHLASGDNLGELRSEKTGKTLNASGSDVQIWPEKGSIAATSGRTQYIRSRNDWGEWFGNDNSKPMYHFPIDEMYLDRNPHVTYPNNRRQVFDPPIAPRVYPITDTIGRFNDLFAANRFTSACSTIIARTPTFRVDDERDVAFICEPVHNLVHRAALDRDGISYNAVRVDTEKQSEFLASNDPWFRPVRVLVGPDDALYIVDMYRETIEHPEWIPDAWQQQLDLYAGSDRGRIYRVVRDESPDATMPQLTALSIRELVELLSSPNGTLRDLVQQTIIERNDDKAIDLLVPLALDLANPLARVHALATLDVLGKLDVEVLRSALQSEHAGVLIVSIRLAKARLQQHVELLNHLAENGGAQ